MEEMEDEEDAFEDDDFELEQEWLDFLIGIKIR